MKSSLTSKEINMLIKKYLPVILIAEQKPDEARIVVSLDSIQMAVNPITKTFYNGLASPINSDLTLRVLKESFDLSLVPFIHETIINKLSLILFSEGRESDADKVALLTMREIKDHYLTKSYYDGLYNECSREFVLSRLDVRYEKAVRDAMGVVEDAIEAVKDDILLDRQHVEFFKKVG